MKKLIIICDSNFALDVKLIVDSIQEYWQEQNWKLPYTFHGYVCADYAKLKLNDKVLPILGTAEEWSPQQDETFAMAIVDPTKKKYYVELLKEKGAHFEVLWAPWVLAPLTMKFEEGCIIAAHSIKEGAKIGPFVTMFHCMLGAATIGEYSSIMAFSNITTATLGSQIYVAPNSFVFERINISNNTTIGANSVVVKDIKASGYVSGIPARRVRKISEERK